MDKNEINKRRAESLRLNNLIRRMGLENYTVAPNGDNITRFEQLAMLIWDHALGFRETDVKTNTEIIHRPDKAFMTMIYDRMEGKIPVAQQEDSGNKASLADRVSDQTKSRLNTLAEDA